MVLPYSKVSRQKFQKDSEVVKEAESVETKETSVVSKSDDLPLEINIIADHTTTLKTETIKLQTTQDEISAYQTKT